MHERGAWADIDPVLRLIEKLLEAFECRIGLYPAEPVLIGPEKRLDPVSIGTVDARFGAAKACECPAVFIRTVSQPEVALPRPPGKQHVAEPGDFLAVCRPRPVIAESRQPVCPGRNDDQRISAQPALVFEPVPQCAEIDLELVDALRECRAVIGKFGIEGTT